MAKLVVDSDSLVSVADAIRTKGGTTEDLKFPNGFVSAVDAIESGGGTEEIENIIDESEVLGSTDGTVMKKVEQLIDKAEDNNLWRFALENSSLPDLFGGYKGTKIPHFGIILAETTANMFKNAINITDIDFYIDCPNSTNGSGMFYGTSALKYLKGVNCINMTTMTQMFGNSGVEVIENPLNVPNVENFANAFGTSIKELRFVKNTINASIKFPSPVLTIGNVFNLNDTENVGSVQSIINGLAILAEDATAQTLTLSKNLPLTKEQKQAITTAVNNKGWTLAFA